MTPVLELLPLLGSAFVLGLAGSLHCVGMCGAFAVISRGRPSWHAGRLLTYSVLGGLAGLLGEGISAALAGAPGKAAAVAAGVLLVGAAFFLFRSGQQGRVPALVKPVSDLLRRTGAALAADSEASPLRKAGSAVLLGASGSLLPCGLVYAALAPAAAAGSIPGGALVGVAFGLGTVPALVGAAYGLRSLAQRLPSPRIRRVAVAMALIVGFAVVAMRAPRVAAQSAEEVPASCPMHPDP